MGKIAMIGAGSIVFCQTLLNDMLATPALSGFTYALMGPTLSKLKVTEENAARVIQKNGLSARVYSTTDRREALKDADYVILMLKVGSSEVVSCDKSIPLKYGVDQAIGDSLGPGGVFRALRTLPVLTSLFKEIEELCPNALVLNYVNPMATVCLALGKASRVRCVGLCHGVQTTLQLIAMYTGVKKEDIDYMAAGINHMAWFLKLESKGQDLYPLLRENMEKPGYYLPEKVRGEVMRHFGYFMTESTHHLSEYLSWFRKNPQVIRDYCDQPRFGAPADGDKAGVSGQVEDTELPCFENGYLEPRSVEYCSYILEAMETDKVFRFNGNVLNRGYITNLPPDCCVEVPVYVDRTGLHPTVVGELPMQLAALNQTNVTVQMLAAEAALTGDPELVYAAVALDPLTSAVLTLQQTRDMVAELFEANREWLPQFQGKAFRKTSPVVIPEGTVGVEVPMDPALAIFHRIDRLLNAKK